MTMTDLLAGVVPIEGGWRIKTTEWCHVDVLVMLGGNHRIAETDLKFPVQVKSGRCRRDGDPSQETIG